MHRVSAVICGEPVTFVQKAVEITGKSKKQPAAQYGLSWSGVVWWRLLRSFPPYPLLGDGSLRKQKYPRLISDTLSL